MRNEEISAKIGQNENAKNKTRIAGIYFSICLWYSTWFILYSIYFSPYFNQRVGIYAAFNICTNCARMTSLYQVMIQLYHHSCYLINIYTQYQVVSRSERMLFKVNTKLPKKVTLLRLPSSPYIWVLHGLHHSISYCRSLAYKSIILPIMPSAVWFWINYTFTHTIIPVIN